jgi:hypothetical protein
VPLWEVELGGIRIFFVFLVEEWGEASGCWTEEQFVCFEEESEFYDVLEIEEVVLKSPLLEFRAFEQSRSWEVDDVIVKFAPDASPLSL